MASDSGSYDLPTSSLPDWILQQLRKFAAEKKIAQIFADDNSSWTYEELLRNAVHVAAGLESVGINSGDSVSFVTKNSHELYAIVLGLVINGVTVGSVPDLPPSELRQNFLAVKPLFVVAEESAIPAVEVAIDCVDLNPKPRIFKVKELFKDATSKGLHSDPALYKGVRLPDLEKYAVCCLLSSGTTGKQKALAVKGQALLRSMYFGSRDLNFDDLLVFNPSQLHWISWWFVVLRSLFRGWTRVFVRNDDVFNVLDVVHKFKPSSIFCTPRLVTKMVSELDETPGRWDLSSLTSWFIGGDVMKKFAHERFAKKFNNGTICQEYGATEVGIVTQSRLDSPIAYGSIGKPVTPLKLVDMDTGKEITEPNNPGEVVVKWLVMREYLNNPDATASSLDPNGWFKTGDIAVFDEAGNYFIVDRIKEMFLFEGNQVYPCELEDIIMKVPGVRDVAVVGKPAGIDIGNLPTAFVVKAEDCNVTEQDIHDSLAKENLHDSKKLRGGVIFTNEIPRNVNGKIVRAKLRAILN